MERKTVAIGTASLLIVSLVLTVLLWFLVAEPRVERVLFFPGTVSSELSGESRILPRYSDQERNIRTVVQEVILGPTSISSSRAVAEDTSVELFMYRDGVVYIDLSSSLIFGSGEVNLGVQQSLDAIKRNISFNFPDVRDIVITVAGHLPFEPVYVGESET